LAPYILEKGPHGHSTYCGHSICGASPGHFPPALRIAAFVQAGILLGFAGIVLARAGIALKRWERVSRWMVWGAVAVSAVSLVLNLLTPSAGERMLWLPWRS
jgi:hypothetical protein